MATSKDMAGQAALAGVRILVAEDSAANRRFIVWCLEQAGARVVAVEDGGALLSALTLAAETGATLTRPAPVDLVVTDIEMPVLDGLAATRLLRRLGCSIPIVALTARTGAEDAEDCLASGCDAFSPKPVDADKLIALSASLLERHRLRTARSLESDMSGAVASTSVDGGACTNTSTAFPATASSAASTEDEAAEQRPADAAALTPGGGHAELRSELADDPDFADLLAHFVNGLPALVSNLETAFTNGQLDEFGRLVHQLKGAGGSYGFPSMTDAARAVEVQIHAGASPTELEPAIAQLLGLCKAAARTPQGPDRRPVSNPLNTLHSATGAER